MIRQIIKIDSSKCNGCGLCVSACHEGAVGLVDGKAKLLRDDYCDGLGNCLPVCPTNAISFEEREAAEFDEQAVEKAKKEAASNLLCGCPGSQSKTIAHNTKSYNPGINKPIKSQLNQWPVQIKLLPANAPYFNNADLLIAADCTAYAYGNFHNEFIKNKITLIGCPKLDNIDYSEKLTDILKLNNIKSITVVRMEVPCCGGLTSSVMEAIKNSKKIIPWGVITIGIDGNIIDN